MDLPTADRLAAQSLARHRAVATALLIAMAALAIGAEYLPAGRAVGELRAAARAGFIGGLADWFAIVALFRHPLGLPIPHTAIIPAQKTRLGRGLGRFVANHVLSETEFSRGIAQLDMPAILDRYLGDSEATRPMAENLARALPHLLGAIEDGRARQIMERLVPRIIGGPGAGVVVARALRGLTASGRHQQMLSFILDQLRETLLSKEDQLRQAIIERVREQGGRLVGWALGASIATRVLHTLNDELDKVGPYGSELRAAFDLWVEHEITRIETDPNRAREIGLALRRVVEHSSVQAWLWDIWSRMRLALEVDAARPNSRAVAILQTALGNLGILMTSDPDLRQRVQAMAVKSARSLLPAAQSELEEFIASVVNNWDSETLTRRLELYVGKDLQYIRINGTIFGFLAGAAIEGARLLLVHR